MWALIDLTKCYECGTKEDIQQHHVVAKSRGGTKTLPLCGKCHRVGVHGMKRYSGDHSRLTREGQARARARGWIPNIKHLPKAREASKETRTRQARRAALRVTVEYFGLALAHAVQNHGAGGKKNWFHKHGTFTMGKQIPKLQSRSTRGTRYTRLTLRKAHERAVEAIEDSEKRELVGKYLFGDPNQNINLNKTFSLDRDLINSLKKCIMILDETSKEYEP